ncbi:MAG TPA: alpha/beta hydrolase [Eoetvoesiella sp.]
MVKESSFKIDTLNTTATTGIRQIKFLSTRQNRRIPGLLWLPQLPIRSGFPLVLVQHGGSGHKADDSTQELVAELTSHGFAVAAIDGPIHGERRHHPLPKAERLQAFLDYWGTNPHLEDFVQDWLCVIESLVTHPEIAPCRLGWYGVSMGTAYGLPVVARSPHIKTAVLGKWSADYINSKHLLAEAPAVSCNTLFVQHWDDEIFDRNGTLAIFDAIGTTQKQLHVYTGGHFGRSAVELEACIAHFSRCLKPLATLETTLMTSD